MLNANVKIKQDYNADALRTHLFSSVSSVDSDHKNATPLKSRVVVTTGPQYPNLARYCDCVTFIASYGNYMAECIEFVCKF